jgi:hypothetical protein
VAPCCQKKIDNGKIVLAFASKKLKRPTVWMKSL